MKIDALVMAGGKGTRFYEKEKPLAKFREIPLVEHVLRALNASKGIDNIYVVTSPWTRKTDLILKKKWNTIYAKGTGYVKDMVYALRTLELGKTLVVTADLPLLKTEDIDFIIKQYERQKEPALAVMVPLNIYEKLGIKPTIVINNLVPAGVNVVDAKSLDGPERILITKNHRLAYNINTKKDLLNAVNRVK